jgi:hypothetical protein
MSEKIFDCIEWMETMDEAWTRLDESNDNPTHYILWREARKHGMPHDLGAAFANFVGDRQEWTIAQVQRLPT